jgi:hypothetical protein
MTNNEVHSRLVQWLRGVVSTTVIKAYQGGQAPALPYVMVNMTGMVVLRQHPGEVLYSEASGRVTSRPEQDVEWRFSVHAYGESPTDILRPVLTAYQIPQAQEPLLPALFIHECSQIRYIPEWINDQWQPRANMDVIMRGLITDGFVIDVIEQGSFDISPM